MNLYNKDKDKDKFQSFVILTKKIHDNYFWASFFIKRSYNVFLLTFMMFKHVKVGKHIEYMHQKSSKNMFIVKFHHGMKCLHTFFFFIPGRNFISTKTCKHKETFHHRQGWLHLWTSSILGWNFMCKHHLTEVFWIFGKKSGK